MKTRRRFLLGALRGLMAIAVLACLGAIAAPAQPLTWNPPCKTITFVNNTGCPATINLVTLPAGGVPVTVVPPFGTVGPIAVPAVPPGMAITGLVSGGGLTYNMVQPAPVPPPPAPPPAAPNGWIPTVSLGNGFCCNDVYFDLASCTVYIFPTAFPCRV
jgi:hypothetical protein